MPSSSSPTLAEASAFFSDLTIEIDKNGGVNLTDNLLDAKARAMNTEESTRMDPRTGSLTASDITLVHSHLTSAEIGRS